METLTVVDLIGSYMKYSQATAAGVPIKWAKVQYLGA
jgi:hypothetical protein